MRTNVFLWLVFKSLRITVRKMYWSCGFQLSFKSLRITDRRKWWFIAIPHCTLLLSPEWKKTSVSTFHFFLACVLAIAELSCHRAMYFSYGWHCFSGSFVVCMCEFFLLFLSISFAIIPNSWKKKKSIGNRPKVSTNHSKNTVRKYEQFNSS